MTNYVLTRRTLINIPTGDDAVNNIAPISSVYPGINLVWPITEAGKLHFEGRIEEVNPGDVVLLFYRENAELLEHMIVVRGCDELYQRMVKKQEYNANKLASYRVEDSDNTECILSE